MSDLADTHLFWITTRGAGLAAVLLAGLSVTVGACIHLARGRGTDLRTLHETLSVGALLCLGLHGAALLADPWLHPGPAGVTVPFLMDYRPLWTGLGIIAGYGLAALGLTYYLRARIGPKRWQAAHRFIVIFWALGVVHALRAGTDASRPWFLIVLATPTLPALGLLLLRKAPALGPTTGQRPRPGPLGMAATGRSSARPQAQRQPPRPR